MAYASSEEYKSFWQKLGQGIFSANYKRFAKGGEVWIHASYNPIWMPVANHLML